MKEFFYSDERSIQMLIYLLKANNIKRVIVSPGATNVTFVGSIQNDNFFEIYSCVDERSAAYMACGLAAESGEPVVISCTGATASSTNRIGHMIPQVIDRSVQFKDIVNLSVQIPATTNEDEAWSNNLKLNEAILELKRHGGGPVHINLATTYSPNYTVKELPPCRVIKRITAFGEFPPIPDGRICVFIGNHRLFTDRECKALNSFCKSHNAVVVGDHTSGYKGDYFVLASLLYKQENLLNDARVFDLVIHIGEVCGDVTPIPKQVWRVSEDGQIRDTFRKLTHVFEMPEYLFFEKYSTNEENDDSEYYRLKSVMDDLFKDVPELPFSNTWIAQHTASKIPSNAVLHLGILNSLRNWDMFETDSSVHGYSNTGGFGIDGILSTAIGASLADRNKLIFVVLGDLAFFYDMNALGNRHIGKNIRIMVVNNGRGTEFTNYNHPGAIFGEQTSLFIAAGGHYGKQSRELIKNYVSELGFQYMSADSKDEYNKCIDAFVTPTISDKPILLEVFTDSKDESDALERIYHMKSNIIGRAASCVKSVISPEQKAKLRNLLKL